MTAKGSTMSRRGHSLRNARYGVFFYAVGLFLSFLFRRYFIQELGAELLGINSTAQDILGFLNVAELGLASAIAFALYRPLAEGDRETINDIVSIQAWFYRIIAVVILAGSIVLCFFFPQIFAKTKVPIWYAYATFAVLLYGTLLSYFFNYRQLVYTSDQREYKVFLTIQGPKTIKLLMQTIVLFFGLPNAYIWWLAFEVIFSTFSTIILERSLNKDYPWLRASVRRGKKVRKQYPAIFRRTGQLIYHKLSSFALQQSGPVILYAYTSATMVTVYKNYLLVMVGFSALIESAFRGTLGSIGNLVAKDEHKRSEEVFRQLFSLRVFIAGFVVGMLYLFMDSFVSLWVGSDLLLPRFSLILFLIYTFQALIRLSDTFLSAYGLYQDVWAPISEAIINLGLSITLGYFLGIDGILWGINISMLLIVQTWKPIFLYTKGFKQRPWTHFFRFFLQIALIFLAIALTSQLFHWAQGGTVIDNWINLIWKSATTALVLGGILLGLFFLLPDFRSILRSLLARFIPTR